MKNRRFESSYENVVPEGSTTTMKKQKIHVRKICILLTILLPLLLAAFFSVSCSFMDSQWGSEETSAGNEKKNNATITAYTDSSGKRIGVTLNFMVVLKNLTIPETIAGEKVLALKFEDVATKTSTQTIVFPSGVIKFDSLAGFSYLSELTLSENLAEIRDKSFTNCSSLKKMVCPALVPPVVEDSKFNPDALKNLVIYVPETSLERYKTTDGWSSFADKIQAIQVTTTVEETSQN